MIQLDGPSSAQSHVGSGRFLYPSDARREASLLDPSFDFSQVPHYTTRRQIESTWKLAPPLQLIDGGITEWHNLSQLCTADCASYRA